MARKNRTDNKASAPNMEYLENLEQHNRQCNGDALLRIWQIVGSKKKGVPALLPVCRTVFLERVKSGDYPPGIHLSPKITAWYYSDIMALIKGAGTAKTTEKEV